MTQDKSLLQQTTKKEPALRLSLSRQLRLSSLSLHIIFFPLVQVFPFNFQEECWCMVFWPAPIIAASTDAWACTMPRI